jgi:rod shape-determining protein MreD
MLLSGGNILFDDGWGSRSLPKRTSFILLAIWILGFLFSLIKGKCMNILGSDLLDMDLLIIMMSYLFLYYGTIATVTFAFGQGLLVDVFSGGLHGLFTTLYLVLFAWIYLGFRIFNPRDPKGQAIIASMGILLKKVLFLAIMTVFSLELYVSIHFLWISGISIVVTGLMAPFLFYIFNWLGGLSPGPGYGRSHKGWTH